MVQHGDCRRPARLGSHDRRLQRRRHDRCVHPGSPARDAAAQSERRTDLSQLPGPRVVFGWCLVHHEGDARSLLQEDLGDQSKRRPLFLPRIGGRRFRRRRPGRSAVPDRQRQFQQQRRFHRQHPQPQHPPGQCQQDLHRYRQLARHWRPKPSPSRRHRRRERRRPGRQDPAGNRRHRQGVPVDRRGVRGPAALGAACRRLLELRSPLRRFRRRRRHRHPYHAVRHHDRKLHRADLHLRLAQRRPRRPELGHRPGHAPLRDAFAGVRRRRQVRPAHLLDRCQRLVRRAQPVDRTGPGSPDRHHRQPRRLDGGHLRTVVAMDQHEPAADHPDDRLDHRQRRPRHSLDDDVQLRRRPVERRRAPLPRLRLGDRDAAEERRRIGAADDREHLSAERLCLPEAAGDGGKGRRRHGAAQDRGRVQRLQPEHAALHLAQHGDDHHGLRRCRQQERQGHACIQHARQHHAADAPRRSCAHRRRDHDRHRFLSKRHGLYRQPTGPHG
jgi:hypothetical protein